MGSCGESAEKSEFEFTFSKKHLQSISSPAGAKNEMEWISISAVHGCSLLYFSMFDFWYEKKYQKLILETKLWLSSGVGVGFIIWYCTGGSVGGVGSAVGCIPGAGAKLVI